MFGGRFRGGRATGPLILTNPPNGLKLIIVFCFCEIGSHGRNKGVVGGGNNRRCRSARPSRRVIVVEVVAGVGGSRASGIPAASMSRRTTLRHFGQMSL